MTTPIDHGPVCLIGMPGGGKSSVGRQLARQLQLPFVDSDSEIESRIRCPIRDFFEAQGEAAFRDIEQEVIAELLLRPSGVIATGGGAVLREANRLALKQNSTVVYLHSTPDELYRRLRNDTQRPLLHVADPLQRLRDMHAERDPLYRETAHFVIETGRPTVATLVNMIITQLELAGIVPAVPERPSPEEPPSACP